MMKKLGKKLQINNETLRAYCGCACINGCAIKCNCSTSTVAYTNLNATNVANVYSNIGSAAK